MLGVYTHNFKRCGHTSSDKTREAEIVSVLSFELQVKHTQRKERKKVLSKGTLPLNNVHQSHILSSVHIC